MVDKDVAFADLVEAIAARFKSLWCLGMISRILQRRAIDLHHAAEFGEGQRNTAAIELVRMEIQMFIQEVLKTLRHALFNFDTDDRTETALFDIVTNSRQQIVGFVFFNFTVSVAGDTEKTLRLNFVTREERIQTVSDQIFGKNDHAVCCGIGKIRRNGVVFIGNKQETRHIVRALQASKTVLHRNTAFYRLKLHHKVQACVGNHRERAAFVNGLRRQNRENVFVEIAVHFFLLSRIQRRVFSETNAFGFELGFERINPEILGLFENLRDFTANFGKLPGGRHLIRTGRFGSASGLSLNVHHANHEEFVEIIVEDGQEQNSVEQRDLGIHCRFKNLTVELNPTDVAVNVQRRIVQRHFLQRGLFCSRCSSFNSRSAYSRSADGRCLNSTRLCRSFGSGLCFCRSSRLGRFCSSRFCG